MILQIHIDSATEKRLRQQSKELDRTIEDLAECAVSEAALNSYRSSPPTEDPAHKPMFRVLTRTVHGWEDAWTEEDETGRSHLSRYTIREEAQAEIDELVAELAHDPEDYKIEEVQ